MGERENAITACSHICESRLLQPLRLGQSGSAPRRQAAGLHPLGREVDPIWKRLVSELPLSTPALQTSRDLLIDQNPLRTIQSCLVEPGSEVAVVECVLAGEAEADLASLVA